MDDYGNGSDSPQHAPSKKRARIQLSCTECRRRKIACTKDTPCQPCVKRNQADLCHTETARPSEPPLSGSEQRTLATRLQALEHVLFQAQPELRHAFLQQMKQEGSSSPQSNHSPQSMPALPAVSPKATSAAIPTATTTTDTENAAAVLENLAFHAISRHTPRTGNGPIASSSKCSGLYPSIVAREAAPASESDSVITAIKATLIKSLPPNELIRMLVAVYFEDVAWNVRVICRPQFEADCNEFFQLSSAGLADSVDPAWLALLFGVLALAIPSSIEKGSLRAETIGESSAASAATKFYRRSIHFFEMAEAHEKPQFRGLQTLLLYIVHLGTVDKDNYGQLPHLGWIVLACKQAQVMGLFDLGEDPDSMPPPDVALPSGSSSLARQLSCRVVYSLLFYDALNYGRQTALPRPFEVSTPPPANVNDRDLGFETTIVDQPLSTPTDMVFEVAKSIVTSVNQKLLVIPADKLTLDDASALTRTLQAASIDFQGASVPKSLQIHCQAMQSVINHTTLRLHRQWLQKALDPAFKASADLCVQSALNIIQCVRRATSILGGPTSRFWLLPMHVLSGVVVLSVTLLSLPRDHPTVNYIWQHIATAQDLLKVHATSSNSAVRRTALQAGQAIAAILERHRRFDDMRVGDYESDASQFLQLVAADLRAPAANETAATSATNSANSSIAGGPQSVTSADHLHSMPSTAKTGDMLNNGISAGEAQFPYVPLESAWVMEDQTLNWLSADLGQSLY